MRAIVALHKWQERERIKDKYRANNRLIPQADYMYLKSLGRCDLCGRRGKTEIHHLIPVKRGGTNDPSNLLVLCKRCHLEADNLNHSRRK